MPIDEQLHSQAILSFPKFDLGKGTNHVDEAVAIDRKELELCPYGHPRRSTSLIRLAIHLKYRYDEFRQMQDLDEAILLGREALGLFPKGQPGWMITLNNLLFFLVTRYTGFQATMDLDEVISLNREARDLCPQSHLDWSWWLNDLAILISSRYKRLREMKDLNKVIVLNREVLQLRPKGHPLRLGSLNNFAVHLSARYDRLGVMANLDEAIVLAREALDLCPQGHPDRWMSLTNLSVSIASRYKRLGAMQDLDEAISLDQEALDFCPQRHSNRALSLHNLAVDLSARYTQLGELQDLDTAIVLDREALEFHPKGHLLRPSSLASLANHLSTRYKRLARMEDLDEAIVLDREAFSLRPQGHPFRSSSLNNLATHLSSRYERLGAPEDLDEAIVLAREALPLLPYGDPLRSTAMGNLARYLRRRFIRSKQMQDKEELFNLYAQLVHMHQIASSADLVVTRAWIRVAEEFQHPTLLLAYETSLRLLVQHLATLPSLPQHLGILKNLTSSLAVDAFSICLSRHAPAHAVELLEQGRGVFWSQLSRLRPPLHDVIKSGPEGKALADEFIQLSSLARKALKSPGADQHERLFHLNLEIQRVVTDIRELPGLSRFLLPLLFSDLQSAASGGPVVIVNASKYSCDALIIYYDRDPVRIPLQITRENVRDMSTDLHTLTLRAKRVDVTRELAAFLRRIWDQIVAPIIDVLQTTLPTQSRMWWCPTSEFSVLPLHAAGPYRHGQLNLPDLYISSYTSTLTALIRARRLAPSSSATQRKRLVAIGQAHAVGETKLLSVGAELDDIGRRVQDLATSTRIDGDASCIARVVEELGRNEWVHLACHGLPNRTRPFASAFALHDGHLTVERIVGCDLQNPEFAYLSACHTTVGDEESPDEVIHLASAMQFAGFRSVIGTMWAVDDGETNKLASTFYKYMVNDCGRLDHTRAAFALNETMKRVEIPFDQRILYIHLGA